MATLIWTGATSGDPSVASNWQARSIRNATYKWTISGSGTTEYYLEIAAGGDPLIPEPAAVQADGVALTGGTAGSLTAGQWDWADNDTLGFSTVYVRLSTGTDPDASDIDYLTFTAAPVASDNLVFPAGNSVDVDASLASLAALSLGEIDIRAGYSGAIGTSSAPFRITCTTFTFEGTGRSYIDLQASNIAPRVLNTGSAGSGLRGLYLIGSDLTTLSVDGGSVGLAWLPGQTATCVTVRVGQGGIWIGEGATVTTFYCSGGDSLVRCALTTLTTEGGSVTIEGDQAITTVNIYDGSMISKSSGTITTANLDGGTLDRQQTSVAQTITTLNLDENSTLLYDSNHTTITNFDPATGRYTIST